MTTDPSCIFCRIIGGELPAHQVFEDDVSIAFLDVSPLFPGHTLVVPKEHHVTLGDLPADQVDGLFRRVRALSDVMPTALAAEGTEGTFVAMNNIVSQSVPHLHVHVAPRRKGDGLRGFFWPRTKYESDSHAADVARRLSDAFAEVAMQER